MNKKRILALLLALFLLTPTLKPKASPQEIIQTSTEISQPLGPLAPIVVVGGLVVAGGFLIYETIKIPHLPDTGKPNSIAIKYHPKTKEPIQYRFYGEDGKPRMDIDLTDHNQPDYHPVPHKHTFRNGQRGGVESMSNMEKELYLRDLL